MQAVPGRHSSADSVRRYQALLQIANVAANRRLVELLAETAKWTFSLFSCHLLAQSLHVRDKNVMRVQRVKLHDHVLLSPMDLPIESAPSGWVWSNQKPLILSDLSSEYRFPRAIEFLKSRGLRSLVVLPMGTTRSKLGALDFGSMQVQEYEPSTLEFLSRVAGLVALATENSTRNRFDSDGSTLDSAVNQNAANDQKWQEIVGASAALKPVLERVEVVAPSNTTVLITGETGTGKELIARAIHRVSARGHAQFVHLNCAAIPTGLLESELFGHEKGAFTSASSQKIGRFEQADQGTLFLDEIGEIPVELQPKLLRALQAQEFERLGGTKTIRVNTRVIAATNRDLEHAIRDRHFRSDLYYRLNVFPIHVPPLRERLDALRPLVDFFVDRFAKELGKKIEPVSDEVIAELRRWHWPGNIRELANFIERSVLLTQGPALNPPLGDLRHGRDGALRENTLEDVERDYIIRTLRSARGVISGSQGAAAKLGMKRTTLQSKIQRLGISRSEYES